MQSDLAVPTGSLGPTKRPVLEGRPLRKPLGATFERKEFMLNMTAELNKKVDAMKARQSN